MDQTTLTLVILLIGVCVVVGGILLLRLHAFLALVLAALIVAVLTPQSATERFYVKAAASSIETVDADHARLVLSGDPSGGRTALVYHIVRLEPESGRFRTVLDVQITGVDPTVAEPIGAGSVADVSPDDLVIHPLALRKARADARRTIGARVAEGFGNTCVSIGILIAMAAIIGKCLLDSGAADRIVRTMLGWLGERGAPAAFVTSGFLLGVPVFFDTVFYLMIPLGKAMFVRVKRNYLLYVLTIVCGATMAHSLVPPTPGPLIVAEQLGIDIGLMILVGGIVGAVCAVFGYAYAAVANRIWTLPLRESDDFSLDEMERTTQADESELPPFWLSLMPILLPVVFIAGNTVVKQFDDAIAASLGEETTALVLKLAATLGDKTLALTIAAAVAMATLVWKKRPSLTALAESMQAALASGGLIILITAAGGAFGAILRQTDVAGLIQDLPQASPLMICSMAWLITTAIRTAQGSATVAMITAVGILSGLARSGDLGFDPVWIACAIGSGSKPIAWMNDSGFWVITRMSGMTEAEGLKYVTPMTTAMGLVGLAAVLAGVTLFPMS